MVKTMQIRLDVMQREITKRDILLKKLNGYCLSANVALTNGNEVTYNYYKDKIFKEVNHAVKRRG